MVPMEAAFVLLGAAIGVVASLGTEMFRQRGRRNEQHDDLYRRVSGEFVGLSIATRYESFPFAQLVLGELHTM